MEVKINHKQLKDILYLVKKREEHVKKLRKLFEEQKELGSISVFFVNRELSEQRERLKNLMDEYNSLVKQQQEEQKQIEAWKAERDKEERQAILRDIEGKRLMDMPTPPKPPSGGLGGPIGIV